jgi:hypothetical protein
MADVMTAVTAFGCEIRVRCDPPWKTVMCEWARWAMASSEAGVMIWSPVLMKYQDGIVFQAAYLDGVLNAAVEAPPGQDDGAVDGLEVVRDVLGVGGQVLQRVRDGPHVVPGRLQGGGLPAPAGRVCPRAVDQDNRRPGLPGRQARVKPVHQ